MPQPIGVPVAQGTPLAREREPQRPTSRARVTPPRGAESAPNASLEAEGPSRDTKSAPTSPAQQRAGPLYGGPVTEAITQYAKLEDEDGAARQRRAPRLWALMRSATVEWMRSATGRQKPSKVGPGRNNRRRRQARYNGDTNLMVMNAMKLFSTVGVDIIRLQLCIPLDHLEEQALQRAQAAATLSAMQGQGQKQKRWARRKARTWCSAEKPSDNGGDSDAVSLERTSGAVSQLDDVALRVSTSEAGAEERDDVSDSMANYLSTSGASAEETGDDHRTSWVSGGARGTSDEAEGGEARGGETELGTPRRRAVRVACPRAAAEPVLEALQGEAASVGLQGRREGGTSTAPIEGKRDAKALWRKLQLRERDLTLDRLLGTAMVHAVFATKSLLSKRDLKQQAALAAGMPWKLPTDRPFDWWVTVFKVLISNSNSPGWSLRAQLWNLIFLQHPNGCFKLTPALATVLKAGPPEEPIELNPLSTHSRDCLVDTLPSALLEAAVEAAADKETGGELAQDVWATILAQQTLEGLPYTWTENPEAAPSLQMTQALRSEMYLVSQRIGAFQSLRPIMADIKRKAAQLVAKGSRERCGDIVSAFLEKAFARTMCLPKDQFRPRRRICRKGGRPSGGEEAALTRSACGGFLQSQIQRDVPCSFHTVRRTASRCATRAEHRERVNELYQLRPDKGNRSQRSREAVKRLLIPKNWVKLAKWLANANPLMVIFMVNATDTYPRSQRLLVQTTTFLLMFTCCVWFQYNRAVTCCVGLRTHFACPLAADLNAPCFDYPSCSLFMEDEDLLPEEFDVRSFKCIAFPERTLTGRAFGALLTMSIVFPVVLILSQIFIMAGTASVPAHWGTFPHAGIKKILGPHAEPMLKAFLVVAYALMFNMAKLQKFFAMALILIVNIFAARHTKRVIRAAIAACDYAIFQWRRLALHLRVLAGVAVVPKEGPLSGRAAASSVEHQLQVVGCFFVALIWAMLAWSLFIYSSMLRNVMGQETETEVITTWALVLLMETFGKEGVKLMLARAFGMALMKYVKEVFFGVDPALIWYEQHILQHYTPSVRDHTQEVEAEKEEDIMEAPLKRGSNSFIVDLA
ncbi:hypothetical protein CYMTET_51443 [Cymbomonas tetramitiformis]|uniref:Uncharacterized protein n=1 Tax=Cymbomonas tetramitiformis TaxID=36881 RepID=A0AAE0BMA2_9CHLO|nr:hypothetical protein CYMTET_51443 [Cymbomonas tetramitiformis]